MPAFLMTTETAATTTATTLHFRVEERTISFKTLEFEVPPGTSVEETAAALKKALHDPYCWAMPGNVVCGATLLDFEEGLFEECPGGPPVIEVLDVIQTDANGEDLEGES